MRQRLTALPVLLLTLASNLAAAPAPWPGWRGPGGTGVSTDTGFPTHWGTNQGLRWRVDLPGPGNSSPTVWGDRVFVSQAVNAENRRTVMCFDRATGQLLWQSGITYSEKEPTQRSNPYCAATPVTDGERVIASFGSAGLYCYDFAGQELWHREFGRMNHQFGNASSPILHGNLCILNFGPDEKARLIAVNKRSGETVWEVEPPKVDPSEMQSMPGGPGGAPGGRPESPGGGRSGFGAGLFLAPAMVTQADRNGDQKLTQQEFAALAEAWYAKLDTNRTGKLDQETFVSGFADLVPPPQGRSTPAPGADQGGPGARPGGDRRPAPGRFVGPGLFAAADTNKDGSVTPAEFRGTFEAWFAAWDSAHSGVLGEEGLRAGLNAALPGFSGPGAPGGPGGNPGGSWSTPLVIQAGGREELIMTFPNRLVACAPNTGQLLWFSKGLGPTLYASPVAGETLVIGMSGGPMGGAAIAVKPGGTGDVTSSHRLWEKQRIKSTIGSGVIHQGHLYTISQEGIAECRNVQTGDTVWEERLQGPTSRNTSWSSLLLLEGRLYIPNQSGDVFVLRAHPKFEVVATNSVGEPTNASLAASGGELFLRTDKALWCFAGAK